MLGKRADSALLCRFVYIAVTVRTLALDGGKKAALACAAAIARYKAYLPRQKTPVAVVFAANGGDNVVQGQILHLQILSE